MNTRRPFRKLGPINSAVMRERSLAFWQAEFHKAETVADAALEAIAVFSCHARLWRKEDIVAMANLNEAAYEAERNRHRAHAHLVWEFNESLKSVGAGEAREE